MSDYFTKMNKAEYGPGPSSEVRWMVVDQSEATAKVCFVSAKTAFLARQKAVTIIHNLSNSALLYPNVVVYGRE